jgi:hypothetical protein
MQYALQHTAAAAVSSQHHELLHDMKRRLRCYRGAAGLWYLRPLEQDTRAAQKWLRMQFPREMRKLLY